MDVCDSAWAFLEASESSSVSAAAALALLQLWAASFLGGGAEIGQGKKQG